MKTKLLLCVASTFLFIACEKYGLNSNTIGGSQSPIGETDNTFTFTTLSGVSNLSATITELTGGVSKMEYFAEVTDTKLLALAGCLTGAQVIGKNITGYTKAKVTSKGIETVYDEGKLILVDYDSKVGDEYSLKRGSTTMKRKVVSKSDTDDYPWSGMLIKTIQVEETGLSLPGVSKIQYVANHRFGVVTVKAIFEDGTSKVVDVYSSKTN